MKSSVDGMWTHIIKVVERIDHSAMVRNIDHKITSSNLSRPLLI